MSNEILTTTETVANDETTTTIKNDQTEASTTNGLLHSNGTNQTEQQPVESTKNTYDDNGQEIYNKNDLEPEFLRKVFIGGLSYKTDDQVFKDYFSKYGDIVVSVESTDSYLTLQLIFLGLYYNA
jgi:RNA recognition motif-containing protein